MSTGVQFTTEQRDALAAAIAKGVKVVQMDGRRVEYASIDEMLKALAVMDRSIAAYSSTPPPARSFAKFSKR